MLDLISSLQTRFGRRQSTDATAKATDTDDVDADSGVDLYECPACDTVYIEAASEECPQCHAGTLSRV